MPPLPSAPARLYCLLARNARKGVIFRRGPSRCVLLIRWNLENDTFQTGQWLKGRIYERRCDLSPSGEKLIYFAANHKPPVYSWTALCKPPWLTAIAFWPKGDCWNGGGIFESESELMLNDPFESMKLTPESDMGEVSVKGFISDRGEDDTVHHKLLRRAGWEFVQDKIWRRGTKPPDTQSLLLELMDKDSALSAMFEEHGLTRERIETTRESMDSIFGENSGWSPDGWIAEQPEIWCKAHAYQQLLLQSELHGIGRKGKNWYDMKYALTTTNRGVLQDLGRLDWAEWDINGDLLFAREGCLYRANMRGRELLPEKLLADFNPLKFEAIASPEEARKW